MLVSIIVPAYKKEKTIQKDVVSIYETMKQTRWDFEIIVVVDGFLDKTFENAKKLKQKEVKVIGYGTNHGKGYAVRFGMARAKGDLIAFIDSGMEIDPNGISLTLEHMEWYEADIIVASKRHAASKANYQLLRKIYSWGYYLLVRFLFGLKVTDTQTGLKVYKREVLEAVLPRLLVKEYAFDIELLAVAKHLGFARIFDAPVQVSIDFSKGSRFKKKRPLFFDPFIRKMLVDTFAVFYRMYLLRYYNDDSQRKWVYDEELDMRVNTGEMEDKLFAATFVPKDSLLPADGRDSKLKFSVIIPVRTINNHLKENIKHLKLLEYGNFEVLIVLDNEEKFDFEGDKRFKILTIGEKGPGEKRNIAAKKATGNILVFLDDDAYPSKEWLTEASKIFADSKVYALGAPAITPLDVPLLEKCSGRVLETVLASAGYTYRHLPQGSREIDDYPTVNLFVRRKAFLEVGGFFEEFWPGEDTKLCLDLVKKFKRKFLYHPGPIVYHHRRTLFGPHLKQVSRYAQHRGQFAKIFPENSRIPFYFAPSLFVLGLIIGPILSYFSPFFRLTFFMVIFVYLLLLLYEVLKILLLDKSVVEALLVGFGIFLTNVVYGVNFMVGLLKKPKLELKRIDAKTRDYTGG